jgi:hypothetical protein
VTTAPLITEAYRAQQAQLHARGDYGVAGAYHAKQVARLLGQLGARSLLDYGCGSNRSLLAALDLPDDVTYEGYDPCVAQFSHEPVPADLVTCIDVLEHIEPELLDNVLDHLASLCDPHGYFTVHTGPAKKTLPDGRNAHLTQQGLDWWMTRLRTRFEVRHHVVVADGIIFLTRSLPAA